MSEFEKKQDKYWLAKSAEILFGKKTEDRLNIKVPYGTLVEQVSGFVDDVLADKNSVIASVYAQNSCEEYTIGHSLNVSMLSILIGDILKYDRETLTELAISALLHDIGKRQTPKDILFKSGKLTNEEFEIMKKHPKDGYDFMERVYPEASERIKRGILEHHERMDNTGYPKGLGWYDISDFARIIAIADVYEGTTALRAYHGKRSIAEGVAILRNTTGLDRNLVDLFTQNTVFYPAGIYVVLSDQSVAIVSKDEMGEYPKIVSPHNQIGLELGDRFIIDILPPRTITQ